MLQAIVLFIIIGLIIFLIVAAKQPAEFRISRSTTISAQPSAVFEHVNMLQKWEAWSPWAKLDPSAKNTFEGPSSGLGAKMSWAGNNKVGVGSMTITESKPYELIRFKLEFLKPFIANNIAEFIFTPKEEHTTVTWSMSGTNNFMAKAMGLLINCDKMVGNQFEQGLAAMKSVVEAEN